MNKLLSIKVLLSLVLMVFLISCDDEETTPTTNTNNTTDTTTTGSDVIDAPNGVYLIGSASSTDYVPNFILEPGVVEGESFSAVPRSGYLASYVYLTAGSFSFVTVTDKKGTTYGGTTEIVDLAGENDQINAEVIKGAWTEDGAAITITKEGLHQVIVDAQTSTFLISPVESWGVIGNATPGSWGADTDLAITDVASSTKVVYKSSGITMLEGEWKVRYNDGWKIVQDSIGDTPGYVAFTNYGGSITGLSAGGSNLLFSAAEEGVYDIELTWDLAKGFSVALTRTGDVVKDPFDPAKDLPWGIIGAATNDDADAGWAADTDLSINVNGSTITWSGNFELIAGREFKFRSDDNWTRELNYDGFTTVTGDAASLISAANNNILLSADADAKATYEVIIVSTDEGKTHTLEFNKVASTAQLVK